MRNAGLHKQYIQNVNFLPGGCGKAEVISPHPPDEYLLAILMSRWWSPCGNINSLALSSVFDIIEQYQMALPCPSAGDLISSGVGGFDMMAPGRDVDVRPNNGYASQAA